MSTKRQKEPSDEPAEELNLVGFRCTELGNAERLVARYRGRIRYCFGRNRWLIWGGKHWAFEERVLDDIEFAKVRVA